MPRYGNKGWWGSAAGARKFDYNYVFGMEVVLVVAMAVNLNEMIFFGWWSSAVAALKFDYNYFIEIVGKPGFPEWRWWWLWPITSTGCSSSNGVLPNPE